MKGREAVRAANRRTQEATAQAEQARAELVAAQVERKQESDRLREQIRQLTANRMAEASKLAAEEVARRLAQLEEERRAKGMSDDIARNLLTLKDKFVFNACRYISMTTGTTPLHALEQVMTWMTDEDFYGFAKPDLIVKLGLPSDGWVAWFISENRYGLRRIVRKRLRDGAPAAVCLDRAAEENHPAIHPNYNPRWYPDIDYRGMELVDDPA